MKNETFTKKLGDFNEHTGIRCLGLFALVNVLIITILVVYNIVMPSYGFYSSPILFLGHIIFVLTSSLVSLFLIIMIQDSKYTIFTDIDKMFLEELSKKPIDKINFNNLNDIVVSSNSAVYRLHELINFEKSTYDEKGNLLKLNKYREMSTNAHKETIYEFENLFLPITFEMPHGASVNKIIKYDDNSIENKVYINECEQISPKLKLFELKQRIDMLCEYRKFEISKNLETMQEAERKRISKATIYRDLPYNQSLKKFKKVTEDELSNTQKNIDDALNEIDKRSKK